MAWYEIPVLSAMFLALTAYLVFTMRERAFAKRKEDEARKCKEELSQFLKDKLMPAIYRFNRRIKPFDFTLFRIQTFIGRERVQVILDINKSLFLHRHEGIQYAPGCDKNDILNQNISFMTGMMSYFGTMTYRGIILNDIIGETFYRTIYSVEDLTGDIGLDRAFFDEYGALLEKYGAADTEMAMARDMCDRTIWEKITGKFKDKR